MHPQKRRELILRYVSDDGLTDLADLAEKFGVSIQTIRADVRQMSEEGLLIRKHGGVAPLPFHENISYENRQVWNREGKRQIARLTVPLVAEGSSVFLGTGTTAEQVSLALAELRGLHVLTNNLHVVRAMSGAQDLTLTMAGGRVRQRDQDVIGADAERFFSRYNADVGILSVAGLCSEGYLYDFTDDEVIARKAIFANCTTRILVIDQAKIGRKALCKHGSIRDFDYLVCDAPLPPAFQGLLNELGTAFMWPRIGQDSLREGESAPAPYSQA